MTACAHHPCSVITWRALGPGLVLSNLPQSPPASGANQGARAVKKLPARAGARRDMGSISGSGRSPGRGNGNPLQFSCLENSMDRGAWWATVHGVAKSRTRLSDLAHTHATSLCGPAGARPSVSVVYSWTGAFYFLLVSRPPHDRRGELPVFHFNLQGGEGGCQYFTWHRILNVYPRCPVCQHFLLF